MTTTQLDQAITLGEVKLRISNLERSIRFYEDIVGLKLLACSEDGQSAILGLASGDEAGAKTLLVLEEIPNAAVPRRRSHAGLYHFALLLPERKALSLVARHLSSAGIPIGQADHLVSEALYISDPDHHGIEIYADRPRQEWKRDANGDYVMANAPINWDSLLAASGGEYWGGLPQETVIGHVHLHVSDLGTSRTFYVDTFGFDIVGDYKETMQALFISAGGYHHHIGMNIWAGVGASLPPRDSVGLDYYTILFPDADARKQLLDHLRSHDIAVTEHGETAIVHDPTGTQIRLRYR
ncbi:VOC family protein [Paenibacillus harenae]|uniref:Catechol 2,3-dioxygenase n=2 Tax=Paenibacillus harenae TaxID=306543 RepID=A0ABT9TYA9_PAEHA|nr:VOC family protein [Paenibacillus harenae]MDQ0112351.1 catechol 2,3-dioxygenase [Paenibacillus harenae]